MRKGICFAFAPFILLSVALASASPVVRARAAAAADTGEGSAAVPATTAQTTLLPNTPLTTSTSPEFQNANPTAFPNPDQNSPDTTTNPTTTKQPQTTTTATKTTTTTADPDLTNLGGTPVPPVASITGYVPTTSVSGGLVDLPGTLTTTLAPTASISSQIGNDGSAQLASNSDSTTRSSSVGAIAGATVGGVVGIAVIGGILTWLSRRGACCRRTEKKNIDDLFDNPNVDIPVKRYVPPSGAMSSSNIGSGTGSNVNSDTLGALSSMSRTPEYRTAKYDHNFIPDVNQKIDLYTDNLTIFSNEATMDQASPHRAFHDVHRYPSPESSSSPLRFSPTPHQ